jgi:transposase
MHNRRGFFDAMQAGDPGAFFFVERIQRIYAVEAEAKQERLTAQARLELRRQRSAPLMYEMRERIDQIRKLPLMKPMREAVRYMRNQWDRLMYPIEHDGRLEIDNGEAERRLRRVAVYVSLCTPSSSAWNCERELVARIATRASRAFAPAA